MPVHERVSIFLCGAFFDNRERRVLAFEALVLAFRAIAKRIGRSAKFSRLSAYLSFMEFQPAVFLFSCQHSIIGNLKPFRKALSYVSLH